MGIDNPHRRLESPPWQTRGAQVGGDQRVFLARRQLTDACSYQCRVEPRHLLVNETIVESFLTVACVLFSGGPGGPGPRCTSGCLHTSPVDPEAGDSGSARVAKTTFVLRDDLRVGSSPM